MTTILALALCAAIIWALVASCRCREWYLIALAAEDALDDLADEVSGRRSW